MKDSPSLKLAKKAKKHDEQKHPRGPDGRWIAAGAVGLGALGLGAYFLLRGRGGAKVPVSVPKAAPVATPAAPKKNLWTFKFPSTPGPKPPMPEASKPVFTPVKPTRMNEPRVELQKPTIVKPISKKELTLAELKAAAKEAKEKGKLLVYRGYEDGPGFWGGKPEPGAFFERPTDSTWVTPRRAMANSWAKHPYNRKDKFRNNPTVQAFMLPRDAVVDLSDPKAMQAYRQHFIGKELTDRYYIPPKERAPYTSSGKNVPYRQDIKVSDPEEYKYVMIERDQWAKNLRAARHVTKTGTYEGAPADIQREVGEAWVTSNKLMREPINNDYTSLKTYAKARGRSGVYDPGQMGMPPKYNPKDGTFQREPLRAGFYVRHPQAIIYNKDALETLGRLPVKKSDASLPLAKFSPLSQAELEQRRNAAKASAEKRRGKGKYYGRDEGRAPGVAQGAWGQKGSGRDKEVRLKSVLGAHYRAHLDKEFSDVVPESAGRGGFKEFSFTPQKPSHMSDEQFDKVSLRAGQVTKALKDPIIQGAMMAGKIPHGTDPKTVNRAFAHARLLALHDVGLGKYHFRMEDQTKEAMKPLVPLIWYARRRLTQDPQGLRPQFKGEWKQFKDEYGEPFKDNRKDPRTGEVRRRFYPHMELLRADQGLSLAKIAAPHPDGTMVQEPRVGTWGRLRGALWKTPEEKRYNEALKNAGRIRRQSWQRAKKSDNGIDLAKAFKLKGSPSWPHMELLRADSGMGLATHAVGQDGIPLTKAFKLKGSPSWSQMKRKAEVALDGSAKRWGDKATGEYLMSAEERTSRAYDRYRHKAAQAVETNKQRMKMNADYEADLNRRSEFLRANGVAKPPKSRLAMDRHIKKLGLYGKFHGLDKADGIPMAKFMAGSMTGKAISSIWNGARSIAPQAWQKLAPSSSKVYDGVGAGMKRGMNSLLGMAAGAQGRQAIKENYKSRLKATMPQANALAGASKDPIRTRAWAMRLNRPVAAKARSVLRAFPRGRAVDIGAGAGLVGGAGYMMSGSNRPPQQPISYRMY